MASGSEIVGAAGGAAAIIPGLIGRGKSNYNAQDISHSGMYNPNAGQFGQYGADNYQYGREQQAAAIDRRTAPQANYMQADMDRQRALQARASQASVMNGLMARAAGQTPSIAGMQAQQDMQRAQASQASMAASARGPAGLALAQQGAANNTANAQSRISNTSQINAANERLQAEQAAFGAASGMRGQDYQSQGQAANQAQYQAGLQMQNRAVNDQRAMGLQQMGHQALGAEQQGNVQMQGIAAQSHANAQQQNAATERQNAGSKGLIDTIGDFFSDVSVKVPYVGSDFNMKSPFTLNQGGMTMGGVKAGAGPSDGATIGGAFHGGTSQLNGSGGMDTDFGTKWNNAELQGMAADPTGGMAGGPAMMMSDDRAKLREAFEEGAKYADAGHAGIKIDAPDYARAAKTRDPSAGPAPSADVDRAEQAHRARMAAAAAAQPKPIPAMPPAATEPLPIQRAVKAVPAMPIMSDFRAKQGLSPEPQWQQADPSQGQFRYVPGRGWIGPDDEQKQALDAAMAKEADLGEPGDHNDDAYWNKRVEDNDRKLAQRAEWAKGDEPKADDGQQMAPGTADFQKTEPKGDGADARGNVPWWMALQGAGKALSDAQFKSDRRAKEVIDLDGVDIDNDPGAQDFDADEYLESKAPKPRSFEELHVKRDTPADQKAVKRAYEDKAGRDADDMIASYKASLGKESAVASRLAPEQSPVAEANRTMVGSMYRYKPEFTPPEQKPGEPNFGFMAQNLEKSPITATAVKEDPNGLKRVDALKLLRILGASVADLQQQQDETRLALRKGGRK